MFLGNAIVLMSYTNAEAEDTDAAFQLTYSASDGERGDSEVLIDMSQTGGAGSPQLRLSLQYSADGSNWVTYATERTDGSEPEVARANAVPIGRYMRVQLRVSGDTAPACVIRVLLLTKGACSAVALP